MKKNRSKLVLISIHVAIWLIVICLYQLFLFTNSIEFNLVFNIIDLSLHICVFYVTLLVIMPLFLKKRFFLYVFLSLLLISGMSFLKFYNHTVHFKPPVPFDQVDKERHPKPPEDMFVQGERPPIMGEGGKPDEHERGRLPKRVILFNSSGVILFYAFAFSFALVQRWQSEEKNRSSREKEQVKTELAFLKQQINPHFLFNSLNSIYSLAISQSKFTTDAILKLSSILRYVLYESENGKVNLSDELNIIQNYIDLQKLRITEKVKVDFKVEGEVETHKIEPFILIPLIENAFKYGVDNINNSFININVSLKEGLLNFNIENKITPNVKKSEDSGIGLKNISRRLELLYPENYSFEWNEKNQVFYVSLEINLV